MRFKKLSIIVVTTLLLLTGCSDPEGLKATIKEKDAEIEKLNQYITGLQSDIGNLTITEKTMETSLRSVEGSLVPEFKTLDDGVIVFPNQLRVDGTIDDVNNSYVKIGSMFKFTPSNNWIVKMEGATANFSHPMDIRGKIKGIAMQYTYSGVGDMKGILQNFFSGFPATNITYRKVFMEQSLIGLVATADITVDDKPHVVNVGFMIRGEYGNLFTFVYEKNETGVQQELVDLLLSSGTYGDSRVKLE